MDISEFEVADTGVMHVKNKKGEPMYQDGKPVQIVLYSKGSRAYAEVESRRQSRALKRMQDNDGKIAAPTTEERIAENADDLAHLTVEMRNLSAGDKTGRELFLAVYSNQKAGYIAEQVDKFIKDWGNFPDASSET